MNIGKSIYEEMKKHAVLTSHPGKPDASILMVPLSDLKWLETLRLTVGGNEVDFEKMEPKD